MRDIRQNNRTASHRLPTLDWLIVQIKIYCNAHVRFRFFESKKSREAKCTESSKRCFAFGDRTIIIIERIKILHYISVSLYLELMNRSSLIYNDGQRQKMIVIDAV